MIAKELKWPQGELAKKIGTSTHIVGKYERDEVKPTIDVIKRLAENLSTTAGFLLGETMDSDLFKDPVMLKRMADIESLPEKDKECLLLTVDNFIRATKMSML